MVGFKAEPRCCLLSVASGRPAPLQGAQLQPLAERLWPTGLVLQRVNLACAPQGAAALSQACSQRFPGVTLPGWGGQGAVWGTCTPLHTRPGPSSPSPGPWLTGRCLESWWRRGKGAHWMGSMGQLDTEMSLAFPESTMGSFMLLELVSQS